MGGLTFGAEFNLLWITRGVSIWIKYSARPGGLLVEVNAV